MPLNECDLFFEQEVSRGANQGLKWWNEKVAKCE